MTETNRRLIAEYTRLHGGGSYGRTGNGALATLLPHILALKPKSLVDYGCGRSDLARLVGARAGIPDVAVFDPAVPERAVRPERVFDLLINVDVLEHVPDEEIDAVVAEMARMARQALIMVDTRPAKARLSDGRDAHVSLHDEAWWWDRLRRSFPTLRPIRAFRRGRVAFKTFDAVLPPVAAARIVVRETVARFLGRMAARLSPGRGSGI